MKHGRSLLAAFFAAAGVMAAFGVVRVSAEESMIGKIFRAIMTPSDAPIPAAQDAPDWLTFEKPLTAWWNRVLIDPAIKAGEKDEKVIDYMRRGSSFLGGGPALDRNELAEEGRNFDKAGVSDPAFLLIAGVVQTDLAPQEALLKKAAEGLSKGGYPKFIEFTAAANISKNYVDSNRAPAEVESSEENALALLRAGLAEKPFQPSEMSALMIRLQANSMQSLLLHKGPEVCDILEKAPGIDPWVVDCIKGQRYINDAWKARGNGWGNTVSGEGWKGFEQNLDLARENLTKSWQLNPKDPAAATSMIRVTMGSAAPGENLRLWFDRAAAARMDYFQAYKSMFWGLRPRWGGSYEAMLAFGGECLKTGRYDTIVPFQYVQAVLDIKLDELDLADSSDGDPLKDPGVASKIEEVIQKYNAQETKWYFPRWLHTLGAIVAYKTGNSDLAKKHLAAIGFTPDPDPMFKKIEDLPAMIQSLR